MGRRSIERADPVGRRRRSLDLGVHVRQLANRVGRGRQHRIKRQQILDRHGLGGELKPEQTQVQIDRLVQDEVRTSQECDHHRRQRQHLENRVAHGVDHRHPNALSVQVLRLAEKPPAFDPLGAERLDDLDALKLSCRIL